MLSFGLEPSWYENRGLGIYHLPSSAMMPNQRNSPCKQGVGRWFNWCGVDDSLVNRQSIMPWILLVNLSFQGNIFLYKHKIT